MILNVDEEDLDLFILVLSLTQMITSLILQVISWWIWAVNNLQTSQAQVTVHNCPLCAFTSRTIPVGHRTSSKFKHLSNKYRRLLDHFFSVKYEYHSPCTKKKALEEYRFCTW